MRLSFFRIAARNFNPSFGLGCIFILLLTNPAAGQKFGKMNLKDSLDGAFDLSNWIIDANGFVPVPYIITEPAFGGFGVAIAPVFLKKSEPIIDNGKVIPLPPNITAAFVGYTTNKSFIAGGARMASIPKKRLRYKSAFAYADLNLSYFKSVNGTEREFEFNLKSIPLYLNLSKLLKNPAWLVGLQYLFINTKLSMNDGTDLPEFVKEAEKTSNTAEFGVIGEYDGRDNIFTPDKGIKAHINVNISENFLGSSFDYQRISSFLYWYYPIKSDPANGKNWISGLRVDFTQMLGDPPFYIVPSVNLRGIPVMRYQGKTTAIIETEQRWDFVRRWSGVFFGGVAKAFDDYSDFNESKTVYNYGAGFRYLIARKFKLRMGIDVAKGPEEWAYYIVFGTNWGR